MPADPDYLIEASPESSEENPYGIVVNTALDLPVQQAETMLASSGAGDSDYNLGEGSAFVEDLDDFVSEMTGAPAVDNSAINRYWRLHPSPVAQRSGITIGARQGQAALSNPMPPKPGVYPLAGQQYALEKADPNHRMGAALQPLWSVYQRVSTRKSFFAWLDSMSAQEMCRLLKTEGAVNDAWIHQNADSLKRGVTYMDKGTKKGFKVRIERGMLMRNKRPFTTKDMYTLFAGRRWAIWVMSEKGGLYSCNHVKGELQHSSLLSGDYVKGAGEWWVNETGKLVGISGKSGHYRTDLPALVSAIKVMQSEGLDITSAFALLYSKREVKNVFQTVTQLLAMSPSAIQEFEPPRNGMLWPFERIAGPQGMVA